MNSVLCPNDDILHCYRLENLKFYIELTGWALKWISYLSPLMYELGFSILGDEVLHCHRHENLKCYIALTRWAQQWRGSVSPVRYELGYYIPEDGILHSHRREQPQILHGPKFEQAKRLCAS
jgi:hypothetical protein